jgi:hypothetical protein
MKQNLRKLLNERDAEEIDDILSEELRCPSTPTDAPRGMSGKKYERSQDRKRRKEDVRRAREAKEKLTSLEPRSPLK